MNRIKIAYQHLQHRIHQHQLRLIIKNHNYGFYHNYKNDVDTSDPKNYYREIAGNEHIIFNHPMYLHYVHYTGIRHNYGYPHGDPQSMSILPNGHTYIIFNVDHGDSSINRIIEYNIRNGNVIKIGRIFHGGHGQGLSYNYKTHQLWICMNHYNNIGYPHGILPKLLLLAKINQKTLRPVGRWKHIKTKLMLGDNITYDKNGNYWNVSRNNFKNRITPLDSLQIYQGRHNRIRLIKDILHSPSACIQNLVYNPINNRIYVVGNGVIMSLPINNINKLTSHDIKVAVMNQHSEFEDIGFWHNHTYLLVHPNRILRSNKLF